MAVTPAQLESIIRITGTGNLITGAATVTDASNYGGIGIATPDTIKVLLRIYDSTMQLVYQNTGFDAGDFTSPDLTPLTGSGTYTFSLPQNPDNTYRTGNYTINMKIQYSDGTETIVIQPTKYLNYCNCCNGVVFNVNPEVSYNTALVSLVDNTQYGAYQTLSRTLTLYPPLNVEAPQSTSAQTLVWVPTVPVSNPAPYTGIWQWTIESTITFTDQLTGATTTCKTTGRGSFNVEQNQLCKVLCLLKKYRTEFYSRAGKKNTTEFEINYLLANAEFTQAIEAERCGRPQTQISMYVDKIYSLIGADDDCDCGCDDGNSQPLVPTSSINGTDGTDGATILNGSGAPDGALGNSGDYYIDKVAQDWYVKVGATWTFLFNSKGSKGDTGAQGATGAAGTNGASVLTNQYPNLATLGTSWESLAVGRTPYVLLANTLGRDGDELWIHSRFVNNATTATTQQVRLTFNGSPLNIAAKFSAATNAKYIVIDSRLSRVSNTTIKQETTVTWLANGALKGDVVYQTTTFVLTIAGLNLTTTAYNIDIQADSATIGDVSSQAFVIEHLTFGTATSTNGAILVDKFTTAAATYIYSRPLLNGRLIAMVVYGNIALDSTQYTLTGANWELTDLNFVPDNSTEVTIFYY